jgi:hypothetical protein
MHQLYEVRIYECAVTDGLVPRPERYRYTNMFQYAFDTGNDAIKVLHWGGGRWEFGSGRAQIYDSGADRMTTAEIVGPIDDSRAMESDRFVAI